MTQLVPCNSTADTVCGDIHGPVLNDTSTTEMTTVPIEADGDDGIRLIPILIPILVLFLLLTVVMCFVFRHCSIPSGTLDVSTMESIDKTVPPEIIVICEEKPLISTSLPSKSGKRQRTFSDSSVVSVRSVSVFSDITDLELWKRDVFDLLSQKMVNWKRFVRLLPGNVEYRQTVTNRCEQIQEEQPRYVPDQIHAALTEWAQRNEGKFVKIESILDTLDKMSNEDQQCSALYIEVWDMCCKLASKEKTVS